MSGRVPRRNWESSASSQRGPMCTRPVPMVRHRSSELALGSSAVVAALLESGARRVGVTGARGRFPSPELHLAAAAGEPRIVRMLLHNGADLTETDYAGRTPLYVASLSGRADVVKGYCPREQTRTRDENAAAVLSAQRLTTGTTSASRSSSKPVPTSMLAPNARRRHSTWLL